jgi:hypothetical protein
MTAAVKRAEISSASTAIARMGDDEGAVVINVTSPGD